jgi:hypothetical protein
MFKALVAGPRLGTAQSGFIKFQAMASEYILGHQGSPLKVFAIIAVRVDHLAIKRLLLHARVLAQFVTSKLKGIPVAKCDGQVRLGNRLVTVSANHDSFA